MDIRAYFNEQKWIFAKTYAAFAPHEYIVRGKCVGTDSEFEKAAEHILNCGIRMFYYSHERKYLFMDGMFYWLMTDDPKSADIINRCRPEDYDIVFMKYGAQSK